MGKDKYPTPKHGERVKCLACNGEGTVGHYRKGTGIVIRTCQACGGSGFYIA